METILPDGFPQRPDIPADGFRPPRWWVLTAVGVILAGGVASAAINFDIWRAQAPRFDIPSPRMANMTSASAIMQAVPLGALVVADRSAQPQQATVKADAKADEDVPVIVEPVIAPVAVPTEAPPVPPGDTAGLY